MKVKVVIRAAFAITLLTLLAGGLFHVPTLADSVSFAHLDHDQEIVATIWMWGCLGYRAKYHLVFRPHPDRPGEVIVERRNVKGLFHRRLPSRTLTAEVLTGLDLGIERYRAHSRGGCISTGLKRIKLKLISDGDLIAEEMYYGNSCDVHVVPGSVDLEDIVFAEDLDANG